MSEFDDIIADDYDLADVGDVSVDIDKVKKNLPEFTSDKLCDIIVTNRYLNFNEEVTILCMEELSRRRQNGDSLLFESIIDEKQKELPPLDLEVPDLRSVLGQLTSVIKVK